MIVECNVCGIRYTDHIGSTPCCGSISHIVNEDGTKGGIPLFAAINGELQTIILEDKKKDNEK